MTRKNLKAYLNVKVDLYNQPSFILEDPICVPHRFRKKQDIEIAALLAATFAWGNRKTIIQKSNDVLRRMDDAPYDFCRHHGKKDLEKLISFRHRTFNDTDLLYFVSFFHNHYSTSDSLETAFTRHGTSVEGMLAGFHNYFFSLEDVPHRTKKHLATPERGSTCKRLNMFLRWMVRKDERKVDFGLWKSISPSVLICPLDLHVNRVARKLGLLTRKQVDWKAALELTENLRKFDPDDPVKYDFALFGLGVLPDLEHK
jgi:uncharacterized protein (TIGR02757 family)